MPDVAPPDPGFQTHSPTGRYAISLHEREVFNTHWLQTPTLRDSDTGETLLAFADTRWSADLARWEGESVVRFTLRKYPGNHEPGDIEVWIDCAARTARFQHAEYPLAEVERRLDAALRWNYSPPDPPPPDPSLRETLRRLIKPT